MRIVPVEKLDDTHVLGVCPMCLTAMTLEVPANKMDEILDKNSNVNYILDPNEYTIDEREFIISGLCNKCQEEVFEHPINETKHWKIISI